MGSFKICWYHDNSTGVPQEFRCENASSNIVNSSDGNLIPECHIDCCTYKRCLRYFKDSNIPDNFWSNPDPYLSTQEDAAAMLMLKQIRSSIDLFLSSGQNLLIYSNLSGNGKTTQAINIARSLIRNRLSKQYTSSLVRYVNIPKVVFDYDLQEKRSYEDAQRIEFLSQLDSLKNQELVIWDELQNNSDTRCENVILRSIIRCRLNERKSNIFICNSSLQELSQILSKSDYNRIINSSISIEFVGSDFRSKVRSTFCSNL